MTATHRATSKSGEKAVKIVENFIKKKRFLPVHFHWGFAASAPNMIHLS